MIKSLASAALLGLLISGTAIAQSSPPAAPQQAQATQPTAQPAETTAPAAPADPANAAVATPAGEMPSTADGCIAAAASLGTAAEGKTFTDDKLDQLDRLFSKLETLCDGQQFAEAMTVAKDIKTMLDGQ